MADRIELYLLRHAHAGDPGEWDGPDAARPLSEKGRAQIERLARFLASVGFRPDAVVTSPKVRAVQTAEPVAHALGIELRLDDRLAGAFSLRALDEVLVDAGDPARPVLVGHDPDFSQLVEELCDAPNTPMRKGAFARIDTRRPLQPGRGELRWLVPPDLLELAATS